MKENAILVKYGEIFLKSEPVLRLYERKLRNNIEFFLRKNKIKYKISRKRGRIFIHTTQIKEACDCLSKIFGIVGLAPCYHLKTSSVKELQKFVRENYKRWVKKNQTFAIRVKRVGKHPYSSQELANKLGKVIDRKVNLDNPSVEIWVEVRDNDTYIYTEHFKGLGGLPVGTSGKVIVLISGGIDSPVAAWLAMKRGCEVVFIHFHSFPLLSKASISKVKKLKKVLEDYQPRIKVYFVPFLKIQEEIKLKTPAKYRIVLYRRMMLRIAEKVARKENAKAIVTGESLAQVSSQTLDNLVVIEEVTKLPVLRPLISFDKDEIIKLAKKLGTYDISILPQEDCCTLFIPKHPTTKAKLENVREYEKMFNWKSIIGEIIKDVKVLE